MVYKSYRKKGKKLFGPYYYHTIRLKNGKTKTIYLGSSKIEAQKKLAKIKRKQPLKKTHVISLLIVALFFIFLLSPQFTGLIIRNLGTEISYINFITNKTNSIALNIEKPIYSFLISGTAEGSGIARIYLLDKNAAKYLLYEFPEPGVSIPTGEKYISTFSEVCGDACYLEGIYPILLFIEIQGDVKVYIDRASYSVQIEEKKEISWQPAETVMEKAKEILETTIQPTEESVQPVTTSQPIITDVTEVINGSVNVTNNTLTLISIVGSGNTSKGENWTCSVMASDEISNTSWQNVSLTILNSLPTHTTPILNSTSGNNYTTDNLTCYNQSTSDIDGDSVINIYNWYRNGKSLTVLNMPFETNVSNITSEAVKDYSGYNNNGTLGGGNSSRMPVWTSNGKIGGAYEFDGVDDYIDVGNSSELALVNTSFTIEAWIYIRNYTPSWIGAIVGKRLDDGNTYPGYYFAVQGELYNNNYLEFAINGGPTTEIVNGNTNISLNNWTHVAVIFNDTNNLVSFYINGQFDGNGTLGEITDGGATLKIGADIDPSFDYLFNGTIDEVKIYNYSLTPEQIYQNYLDGLAGHTDNRTIVSEETSVGDNWTCEIIPNDGVQDGTAKNSSVLTIVIDTSPTITDIKLDPEFPTIADDINCSAIITDGESTSIGANFTWYINGQRITDYDSSVTCQNNTRCYAGMLFPAANYEEYNISCGIIAWGKSQLQQSLFLTGRITGEPITTAGDVIVSTARISYERMITSLSPNIECSLTPEKTRKFGVVNITCNASDDRLISDVWANINTPSIENLNMRMELISGNYSNGTFLLRFTGTSENGSYSVVGVYINDTQGAFNRSEAMNFYVDIYYPSFSSVSVLPVNAIKNDNITVLTEIPDKDIDSVVASVTDAYGRTTNYTMAEIVTSIYKSNFIANTTGTYKIYIYANDSVGNMNRTFAGSVSVIGGDSEPYISFISIEPNITQNTTPIYIFVKAEDDYGINTVKAKIEMPNGSLTEYEMERIDLDQKQTNITENKTITCGEYIAQQFVPQVTAYLPKISLYMKRDGDTNLIMEIYSDYYNRPFSSLAGVLINQSNISTTAAWTNFTFIDRAFLRRGNKYWIVFSPTTCTGNVTAYGGSGLYAFYSNSEDEGGKIWNETMPVAFRTYYTEENMYRKVYSSPLDGNYSVHITAEDTAGQKYMFSGNFTIDSIPPAISSYSVNNPVNKNQNFTAQATVQDVNLDVVNFIVIDPHGREEKLNYSAVSGNTYYLYYNATITGTYSVSIIANDFANNWNYTDIGSVTAVGADTEPPVVYSNVVLNRFRKTGSKSSIYVDVKDNTEVDTVIANITYSSIIKNSDFEIGTEGWEINKHLGNITVSTSNRSLNISSLSNGYAYVKQNIKRINNSFNLSFDFYPINLHRLSIWADGFGIRMYKNKLVQYWCFDTKSEFYQNITKSWHNIKLVVNWTNKNCSVYYDSILKASITGTENISYISSIQIGDFKYGTWLSGEALFDNIRIETSEIGQNSALILQKINLQNLTDNFTEEQGWEENGNWVVQNGMYKITDNAGNRYALKGDDEWMDYEYSVDIIPNDDDGLGILFRYIDSNDYYLVETQNANLTGANAEYTGVKLFKYYEAVEVNSQKKKELLAFTDRVRFELGQKFNLKVRVTENRIRVYWDNDLIIDATDTNPHRHGKIGLWSNWHSNALFDNLSVTVLNTNVYTGNYTHGSIEGAFKISIYANDSAGNENITPISYIVTDNTAPRIDFYELWYNNLLFTCAGRSWGGHTYLRIYKAEDESDIDSITANISTPVRTYKNIKTWKPWWNPKWNYYYIPIPKAGNVSANITVRDKAGNTLTKSITREVNPICFTINSRNLFESKYYWMRNETIRIGISGLNSTLNLSIYNYNETTLVPHGSKYKYYLLTGCGYSYDPRESTCAEPSNWEKEGFDDSSWKNITTPYSRSTCNACTGLFRKTFNINSTTGIERAELRTSTSSIECYINNESVAYEYSTWGWWNMKRWYYWKSIDTSLLKEGENTLACRVKATPPTMSTKLGFDAELVAYYSANKTLMNSETLSTNNEEAYLDYHIPHNASHGTYIVSVSNGTKTNENRFFVLSMEPRVKAERLGNSIFLNISLNDSINKKFEETYKIFGYVYPLVINTSGRQTGIWNQRTYRGIETTILIPSMLVSPQDVVDLILIVRNYANNRKIRLSGGRVFLSPTSGWSNAIMHTHIYRNFDIESGEILTLDLVMDDFRPVQPLGTANYLRKSNTGFPTRYVPSHTKQWGHWWDYVNNRWVLLYSMSTRGPFILPEELKGEVVYGATSNRWGAREGEIKLEDAYAPGNKLVVLATNTYGIGMEAPYNTTIDFDMPNLTAFCYPNPSYNQTVTCNASVSDISNISEVTFKAPADVLFNESFENDVNISSYTFTEDSKIIYDEQDPETFFMGWGWDRFDATRTNETSRTGNYSYAVTVKHYDYASEAWLSPLPTSHGVEKLSFSYKKTNKDSVAHVYFHVNGRWHQIAVGPANQKGTIWYQGWGIYGSNNTDWNDVEVILNTQEIGTGRHGIVSQNGILKNFEIAVTRARPGDTIYFDNIKFYYDADNGDTDTIYNITNETSRTGKYSLKLINDTWVYQSANFELSENTTLHFYIYSDNISEIQGIGIGNDTTHIVYPIYGLQEYLSPKAINRYWNTKANMSWQEFNIPIGKDWYKRHGSYTNITKIIYVNDGDNDTKKGIVYFDDIKIIESTGNNVAKTGNSYSTTFYNSSEGNYTFIWKIKDANNNTNFYIGKIVVYSLPQNFTVTFRIINSTDNEIAEADIVMYNESGVVSSGTGNVSVTLPPHVKVNINISAYNHTFAMYGFNYTGNFIISPVMFIDIAGVPELMQSITKSIWFNKTIVYDNITLVLYKENGTENRICRCETVEKNSTGYYCGSGWVCDTFSVYNATDNGTHVSFTISSFSAYALATLESDAPGWISYAVPKSIERCGTFTITAQWNEAINESYVEYNSTSSALVNYSANITESNVTYHTTEVNASWLNGNHSVRIYAKDQAGNWNSTPYRTFNIINHLPEFDLPAEVTIGYTETFLYDVNATDSCENNYETDTNLTYYTNSTFLTINSTTGLINWTANYSYIGEHTIYITVGDGTDNVTKNFTLKVNDLTNPNVTLVSPPNGTTYDSSNTVTFIFIANDTTSIKECWVITEGIVNGQRQTLVSMSSSITTGASNQILHTLSNGNYEWKIGCRDIFGNEGSSNGSYLLTVSYTAPPISGGGGGDSMGGAAPVSVAGEPDLKITPKSIYIESGPGRTVSKAIDIENNGTAAVTVNIYGTGDIAGAIARQTITLGAGEKKKINIKIYISQDTPPGNYSGYIVFEAENIKKQIPFILNILEEMRGLLDVKLALLNDTLVPGQKLLYSLDMYYFGEEKPVIINILSRITSNGNVISEYKETAAIKDELSLMRLIEIPENTPPGEYELKVEIFYFDNKATASASLNVVGLTAQAPILLILLIVAILIVSALYMKKHFHINKLYRSSAK